jgi:lipoprotein-anchoring transpeptidase ErfK/SrfK
MLIIILAALAYLSSFAFIKNHTKAVAVKSNKTILKTTSSAAKPVPVYNPCSGNQLAKLIVVSISKRHTWACQDGTAVISTPVITGNENLASDLTPTGTYHIISKQRDVKLIGCDTDQPNVCWNDFVHYDMIFLYNKYGHYDFHDATWRTPNDFGNISPYSSNASHGCVETPINAMSQLYNWTNVGTQIEIKA